LYYWLVRNEEIKEVPVAEISIRGEELVEALAELNCGLKLLPQGTDVAEHIERELVLDEFEVELRSLPGLTA
jgi:hypothetical protein